ncbi:MAG: hypothetical protein ACR2PZ_10460 [Pseudomonadales bacterium]
MTRALLALVCTCLVGSVWALEQPIVKVALSAKSISVGEPLELQITVLGPTWFPQAPVFPSFELPNAVVRLPPNTSRGISERIGQELWSGVTRTYQIFPLIGGSYQLAEQQLRVVYADPGRSPLTTELAVPAIEFKATVPAGAQELNPYIAGRSLTLERVIEGEADALTAGDALVVRYVAELDGLLALFLPALISPMETPGMSVYADQPVLTDEELARRTETVTYVFSAGGTFSLPATSLRWWNTSTNRIETANVPALTLTVAGPPIATADTSEPRPERSRGVLFLAVALLAPTLWLLYRLSAAIRAWWHERRQRWRASEGFAFKALQQALTSGEARSAHHALLQWLDRLQPSMDSRQFALRFGEDQLADEMTRLRRYVYMHTQEPMNLQTLSQLLQRARRRHQQTAWALTNSALPPLNP